MSLAGKVLFLFDILVGIGGGGDGGDGVELSEVLVEGVVLSDV